jgi:uncharacterized protein YbjT (DUF2867 family)
MERNVAVVAGSTGLVGRYLTDVLLEDSYFDAVVALTRRSVGFTHARLEQRLADFDDLIAEDLAGATHLFCVLGATMRAAGSHEAFRRVDYDACASFARMGRAAGARRMTLLSSVGASARASSFYLRTKGELEEYVKTLGFEALHIFRPSVLLGHREVERPGERWAGAMARGFEFLMRGRWSKYRPMPAGVLAASMAATGERGPAGVHVYHYDEIRRLATGRGI